MAVTGYTLFGFKLLDDLWKNKNELILRYNEYVLDWPILHINTIKDGTTDKPMPSVSLHRAAIARTAIARTAGTYLHAVFGVSTHLDEETELNQRWLHRETRALRLWKLCVATTHHPLPAPQGDA